MTQTDTVNAQIDLDMVYAGYYIYIQEILSEAEHDESYRAAAAELGRVLRDNGTMRASLKNSNGWNKIKTAWDALKTFIRENGDASPWWSILDFADGKDVGPAAGFFSPAQATL